MTAILTRKPLPRRALLRGAGAALALPFLESMLPVLSLKAQTLSAPTRLACIYFPHGATMSLWTPKETGKHFTMPRILEPLEAHREQLTIVSNLGHPLAYGPGGATGNHNRSSASYLSGAWAESGPQPRLGITMDQVAVQAIGQDSALPSLELMIEQASLNCGEGLNCAYRNTISWQGPTSPLPMQNNPQVVFEQLFGDGATQEQRDSRRELSLSLLDALGDEIRSLNKKLSVADRQRLDLFLTDVREIERRIAQAAEQVTDEIAVPDKPAGIPGNVEEHILLMYELQVLAWQTGITRVSTFLMANELSNAVYPASGIRDSYHTLSHHSNNEDSKLRFAELNRYHATLLARFLDRLKATPDGDGSLLDHAMILYGSGMSDGNSHNHDPLPLLLAGGASGKLEGNRHLMFPERTPMSNLLLALLHKLGVEADSFGDSTEALAV
jgi:hypothetical protein